MEAIRQFVKVKNNQINITLPNNFNEEEVEVIILAKNESATDFEDFLLSDEDKKMLDFRANQPKEDFISAEESINRMKKKYGI